MNKGVRLIDNIAALKFCKENQINNVYNIIINYPNEEKLDFEETKKNINLFKQYLDPPQISKFIVKFGSPIHQNPGNYNIKKFENINSDKLIYPKAFLEKNFNYYYNFKRRDNFIEHDWEKLISDWNKEREISTSKFLKSQSTIDKLIFYFVDGGNFIKIYDKRNSDKVMIYMLNKLERDVLLSCSDVISYKKLQEKLPHIPDYQLAAILHSLEENNIVFREENNYLTLPLSYSIVMDSSYNNESKNILTNLYESS
jgi:hypothetical protein